MQISSDHILQNAICIALSDMNHIEKILVVSDEIVFKSWFCANPQHYR